MEISLNNKTASNCIALVLAHPDDEMGLLPLIRLRVSRGDQVYFFYLTNGSPSLDEEVIKKRESETLSFLSRSYGIKSSSVFFLGRKHNIIDSRLHKSLNKAYSELTAIISSLPKIDELFTLCWEGGHQDHDSAYICSRKLVKYFKITKFYQFSLYNRYRCNFIPFDTNNPVHGLAEKIRYTMSDLINLIRGYIIFRSQSKTWLFLGPIQLLKIMKNPYLCLEAYNPLYLERPHDDKLLYEKMFGISYTEIEKAIKDLD